MSEITESAEIKNGNPKGTITLNEAMAVLKGKPNSYKNKTGLRTAAFLEGFKSELRGSGKESFLIDVVKFQKWIKNTIDAIPEGFILVGKSAKELDVTSAYVYKLIKKYKIKIKKAGTGKKKIYVDFSALKAVCKNKGRERLK